MYFELDIIIPEDETEIIGLFEKKYSWDNEYISCDPPRFITDKGIIFEKTDLNHFEKYLGDFNKKEYIALHFTGNIFNDLGYSVNNSIDIMSNNLIVFLSGLLSLSMFYIFLVREDENVKERYRISNKEDIAMIISKCFNLDNPDDVLMYRDKDNCNHNKM